MQITFACPSCGAAGSVDESLGGRNVRCKHCTQRFAIPNPGEAETDGYALAQPPPPAARAAPSIVAATPVYIQARGDEPPAVPSRRKSRKSRPRSVKDRRGSDFAWTTWFMRGGAFVAIIFLAVALIAPHGVVVVGSALLLVGMALIVTGYAAGAYGAFSEDFLYGFLYLIIPLYTAYYLISRWDDLARWIVCSTAGVGLVLIGAEMLRWAGFGD